jgi:phosphatidylserine decarboxylase
MYLFGTRLPFDSECKYLSLTFGVLATVSFALGWNIGALFFLCILLALLAFFRDPPRRVPRMPGAVVSPADGKVVQIHTNENREAGPVGGPCISIFLSVLDVHVNRAPFAGTVQSTRVQPGIYHDARDPRSAEENKAVWVHLDCGEFKMTVRLIAGWVARQIVCRARPGQRLFRGERIGMIRLGSRTELYLPPEARVQVEVGQTVRGGSSVLAYLPSRRESDPAGE